MVAALVILSACHKKKTANIPPPPAAPLATSATSSPAVPPAPNQTPAAPEINEVGLASWYGHPYHGRASASGEIYDMEQMTAAHRTLPFGAQVRVYDLDNQKSVDVRINDRGPFVDGRVIDLSHAAARAIDMIGPGTARVRLEILSTPAALGPAHFAVQVGAFRNRDNAERLRREMEAKYGRARLIARADTPGLWRVLVGLESTQGGASALAQRIRSERASITSAFVVRLDSV
jgi:rare lipoprotein A